MRDLCRAVLAGDAACLRTAALAMGLLSAPTRSGLVLFDCGGAELAIQFGAWVEGTVWPGGTLVWLVPERGPSAQDLLEWRQLTRTPGATATEPWVIVCTEPGAGVPLENELQAIAAAIADASLLGGAFRLGCTERTRLDRSGALGRFLRTLIAGTT